MKGVVSMGIIQFPNLFGGIRFYIDRVAFDIFGVNVYWYGLFIAFGFILSMALAGASANKFKIKKDDLYDLILICAPVAIICARLFYVFFDWDNFKGDLSAIINFRQGGLAIYGAVIGAFLAGYFVSKKKKMIPLRVFDFAAPYFALSQAIGRWGNFVNQEAFGTNTTLPWGMTGNQIRQYLYNKTSELAAQGIVIDPEMPVHPTFLYESLWNFVAFFLLIRLRKNKKVDGEVFFGYMFLYGLGRSWIEGLRTDSLMAGGFRISQLLAVLFVVAFGILFIIRRKKLPHLKTTDFYDPDFKETAETNSNTVIYGIDREIPKDKNEVDEDVGLDNDINKSNTSENNTNENPKNNNTIE